MGDPMAPPEGRPDRPGAQPREGTDKTPPTETPPVEGGGGEGGKGSASEQARIDREAGDVADDLADFA